MKEMSERSKEEKPIYNEKKMKMNAIMTTKKQNQKRKQQFHSFGFQESEMGPEAGIII